MKNTESTKESYRKNSVMLLAQYSCSSEKTFEPLEFCNWLAATKFPLAAATWRMYRASVLFYIEEHFLSAHSQCSEYLSKFSSHNKPKCTIRGKRKGYSEAEFSELLEYIRRGMHNPRTRGNGKAWWTNLYYTLRAGDLSGLRPSEWLNARIEIIDGKHNLVVSNAKTTHDRAHGETRTINISELSLEDISIIQSKIEATKDAIASGLCKDIDDYQSNTRRYLLLANNAVFPNADKTIAAYSTRHQVVTEYKSTPGNTAEGLAAILGHRSTETAGKHYGRKRSGKGKLKPSKLQADPGDQKRVAAYNAHRDAGPRGPRQKPPTPPPRPSGPSM